MYCGTNKTALTSQRQISEAMMRLIRQKPYAQITVSELCREAGISRQTFYSLFTSRENVMVFTLQARYCYAPAMPDPPDARRAEAHRGVRQLCRGYSEYFLNNRALLKTLVSNRIDYLLYDSLYGALDGCGCFLNRLDPRARRYAVSFYAGGLACAARRYVEEGCVASADELTELLYALFTGAAF